MSWPLAPLVVFLLAVVLFFGVGYAAAEYTAPSRVPVLKTNAEGILERVSALFDPFLWGGQL